MISLNQQIASVAREIALRKRVYPRWVREKRMARLSATFEIEAMEAVLETLQTVKAKGEHDAESENA